MVKENNFFMNGKCVYCGEIGHDFSEACPLYISRQEIADKEVEVWKLAHAVCPKCGNDKLMISLVGPIHIVGNGYRDDINTAECINDPDLLAEFNFTGCGWKGKVNELVPKRIQIWD